MLTQNRSITRREFAHSALVLAALAPGLRAASPIDDVLRTGIAKRKIPCAVAMVATPEKILYQGAFGTRDAASKTPVTIDSIFAIASMTKAVTSVAALQLVDQGKLTLDEPVSRHIPEFAELQVFAGADASGKPILRPVRTPVTLRHLLTHTSGFAYAQWSKEMTEYEKLSGTTVPLGTVAPNVPLIFEPGTRWQYGYSTDRTGKLVEAVSGLTLEQYFQRNILQPLAMQDTSFLLPPEKFDRWVSRYDRQPDGSLKQEPRQQPAPPKEFNGGGGLYSTAGDYVKFMRMILGRGVGGNGNRILQAKTVELMTSNQIGNLTAGKLKSFDLARSADVDVHPGANDAWGLGFLINRTPYSGGRSAGSLAWAGLANTFYWIDPKRNLCATLMMQYLPFVDKEAVGLLGDFERAVYAS
jgi:methyl acetate hydrolase